MTIRRGLTPFTLKGRHVRLEPLSVDHADDLALASSGDRRSYGFTTVPDGSTETASYVQRALSGAATGRELPFAVRRLADGAIVGTTRFLDLEVFQWPPSSPSAAGPSPSDAHPPSAGEIGSTWYAPSAQRTVVNTECKFLLLEHAFQVWGSRRICFKTDARNEASRRAIQRIGGQFEGIRRRHVAAVDGTIRDSAYFSILAEEWPAVRARFAALLPG